MARIPRWVGDREVIEAPNSPKWDFVQGLTTCVRTFIGPYEKCLTTRPAYGASMTGFSSRLKVKKTTIQKQPGGKGQMVVTLVQETRVGVGLLPPAGEEYQEEIEWAQIDKKIEGHPRYKDMVDDVRGLVNDYFAADEEGRKEIYDSSVDPATGKLTELGNNGVLAIELLKKKLRGQESYIVFAPVLRITRQSDTPPKTTAAGLRVKPNSDVAPAGYEWLKTADRGLRSGRHGTWEVSEEFTGSDEWDHELYAEAPNGEE